MVSPYAVTAPKDKWQLESVLYTGNDEEGGSFSIAEGKWNNVPVVAIRWDGEGETLGYPVASRRHQPVWFVLPEVVGMVVRTLANVLNIIIPSHEEPQEKD